MGPERTVPKWRATVDEDGQDGCWMWWRNALPLLDKNDVFC